MIEGLVLFLMISKNVNEIFDSLEFFFYYY